MKDQPTKDRNASAPLPRPRSFVVQIAADAAPPDGMIRGRAIHIVSGEPASFESMAELLGSRFRAIAADLDDVKKVSGAARRVLGWRPRGSEEAIGAAASSLVAKGLVKK